MSWSGCSAVPLEIELICVDDGSRDGSRDILSPTAEAVPANAGSVCSRKIWAKAQHCAAEFRKPLAISSSFRMPTWNTIPRNIPRCSSRLSRAKRDVVYGSRFLGSGPHRVLYFWHSVGNSVLTLLSNCLTNINLTDMETCYKAFRREIIQSIPIEENRFGFEPEITVKVAKRRLRIYEVGIRYWGRTYEEGKKIGWKDGVRALWCLVKYSLKEPAVAAQAAHDAIPQPSQKSASTGS